MRQDFLAVESTRAVEEAQKCLSVGKILMLQLDFSSWCYIQFSSLSLEACKIAVFFIRDFLDKCYVGLNETVLQ